MTIEELLEMYELTQTDLAELIGCHFTSVSSWVNGKNMSQKAYAAIMELFDLQEGDLIANVAHGLHGNQLGSGGWTKEATEEEVEKRRGQKRSPETRRRIKRGLEISYSRVTTTIEEWKI